MGILGKKLAVLALGYVCLVSGAVANELTVVGTGDGLDMLRAIAVEYSAQNPNRKISVPVSIGSGGGILAVGSDKERMGRVARPLKKTEAGLGLEYLPIAKIPSAIFANRSANVTAVTSDQLAAIFSGKVRNWSEVGGSDARIKVVRREESDSTLQVLRATMPGWADLAITEKSKTAITTQDATRTVGNVEGAVGFGPYSRVLDLEVNVLKIDGKSPTDSDYPSSVVLALIYKQSVMDDEMRAFLDFSLSEGAAKVIDTYGGVPLRE